MRLEIDEIKEGSLEEFIERHDLRLVLRENKNGRQGEYMWDRWRALVDGLSFVYPGGIAPAAAYGGTKARAVFALCEKMRTTPVTFGTTDHRPWWHLFLGIVPANCLRGLRLAPAQDYDTLCSSNLSTTSSPPPSSPCTKAPRRAASKRSAPSTAK